MGTTTQTSTTWTRTTSSSTSTTSSSTTTTWATTCANCPVCAAMPTCPICSDGGEIACPTGTCPTLEPTLIEADVESSQSRLQQGSVVGNSFDNWLPAVSILLLVVSCCQSALIGVLLFKRGQDSLAITTSSVVPCNETVVVPTTTPLYVNDRTETCTATVGAVVPAPAHDQSSSTCVASG